MISHYANQLALRTKLLELANLADTGSIILDVTGGTGSGTFTRLTGSFLTDGFRVGMEITSSGFETAANNTTATITAVAALTMTVNASLVTKSRREPMWSLPWGAPYLWTGVQVDKRVVAALPATRSWENIDFEPTPGTPYVVEEYVPGPMFKATTGPLGELEARPMYALKIVTPANAGMEAASKYADALLQHFAPTTAITVGSDVMRVRGDVAPYRGQLLQAEPGYAVVPVTIPLWLRTSNSV